MGEHYSLVLKIVARDRQYFDALHGLLMQPPEVADVQTIQVIGKLEILLVVSQLVVNA